MTALRSVLALLALVIAAGLVGFVLFGDGDDETAPDDVAIDGELDPDDATEDDGAIETGDGTTPPRTGTDAPEGDMKPPTATQVGPGMREPFGQDLSDPEERAAYLEGLVAQRPPVWDEIARVLKVMDEELPLAVREFLIRQLTTSRQPRVLKAIAVTHDGTMVKDLVAVLDDPDLSARARRHVLQALSSMPGGDPVEVVQALESRLADDVATDRRMLHAIAAKGGPEAARVIVEYLTRAPEPGAVPQFVMQALDVRGDPDAARVVRDALGETHMDQRVRQRLLAAVAQPGAIGFTEVVRALDVEGQPHEIREQALRTLSRIGGKDAVTYLLERSGDPGQFGNTARTGLGQISASDKEGRALLVEAFESAGASSHPTAIRGQIVRALANLREAEAAPIFVGHIGDSDDRIRHESIRGLARLGHRAEPYVPQLVEQFAVADDRTKVRIAVALGTIGGDEAIKAMEQMVSVEEIDPALHRTLRAGLLDAGKRRAHEKKPTPGDGDGPGLGGG